ncbi:MAG TPA: hypothetical protein VIK30_06565 [Polyangia bacterium]
MNYRTAEATVDAVASLSTEIEKFVNPIVVVVDNDSHILNPDASLKPGALDALVGFMKKHPEAGLLGNLVQNAAGDQLRGFRFPSPLGELERGACLGLISRLLRNHKVVNRKHTPRPGVGRDFIRYSLANVLKPAPEAEQNLSPGATAG